MRSHCCCECTATKKTKRKEGKERVHGCVAGTQELEQQISLVSGDCMLAEKRAAKVEKENERLQGILDRQAQSALGPPDAALAAAPAPPVPHSDDSSGAAWTAAQAQARCMGREDRATVKAHYQAAAAAVVAEARQRRQRVLGVAAAVGALVGAAVFVLARALRAGAHTNEWE